MAGGKETPRQKMIGLMYLVLMALLAMNVSKEIINAFVTLNNNMAAQNKDMEFANGEQIQALAGKANSPELGEKEKAEAKIWYDLAVDVRNMTRRTANFYMDNANDMLVEGQPGEWLETDSDGFTSVVDLVVNEYSRKDDYDIPTRLFVGDNHHTINEKGTALKTTLENYRDSLCILIGAKKNEKKDQPPYSFTPPEGLEKKNELDTTFLELLDQALETVKPSDRRAIQEIYRILTVPTHVMNHGEEYPWQAGQFDHAPIAAAVAMLTSLKGKVLQAEKVALNNFNEQSSAPPFKFNKIDPLAFSNTAYINQGDSLDLSVMIAAYDSTAVREVRYWWDDSTGSAETMKTSSDKYISFGGGPGNHFVDGQIAVETKSGLEWKPFKRFNYSVGSPNAAVAAADLNVLYRQWDNKIKVSASGYDPSTVSVSCSGCSISKSGEFFIAKVSGSGKTAKINVSAKDGEGNSVSLASEEFRIFPLPTPKPYFAGQTFDKPTMKKGTAMSATKLTAKLGDSPLNVPYTVTSYKMIVSKNGKIMELKSNGANLSGEMKNAIKKTPKGGSVTFINVTAKGPGGKAKPIGGLSFKML